MFEHIFRIVIAKISILTLNRINATEPASAILKQQILGSIFYEKLSFDGKKCRTPKMNPVIDLISSHNVEFKKKKKGQPLKKKKLSLNAENEGLIALIPKMEVRPKHGNQ